MRKETRYMRNSHNMVNESGNQMPKASNVHIAHMDMKPLLLMVMTFFFILLFLGLFGYIQTQNQIQDLKTEVIILKQKQQTVPYIIRHVNK